MATARQITWATWLLALPSAWSFCPAGFDGSGEKHKPEWNIPDWPMSMTPEEAGRLRTVTLGGFEKENINEEYLEGPTKEFMMQGRETYWQASGMYFMFFCQRYQKWRIAGISAFGENKEGNCFGFCSDGMPGRDIRNETYLKGWIEVVDSQWQVKEDAGVVHLGILQEQLDSAEAGDEEECVEEDGEEGESGETPFGEKKRTSKCPVTKAAKKLKEGLVKFGKWVKRLFPKLLGAPEEESSPVPGEQRERKKTVWEQNKEKPAAAADASTAEAQAQAKPTKEGEL